MAPGNWIVYSQLFGNWNDCGLTHSCPHLALGLCKHPVLFPKQLQDTNAKCFPGNSQPSFSAPKAQSNLTKCRRLQVHTHPRPSSPGTLTRRLSASSDNSNFAPSENMSSECFSARYKGFPTEVQWEENTVENTGGFLKYSQVLPVGLVTRVLRRWLQPGCTFWIFPVPVEDAQAGKEVWDAPRGPLLVVVEACPYSRTCYGAHWPYCLPVYAARMPWDTSTPQKWQAEKPLLSCDHLRAQDLWVMVVLSGACRLEPQLCGVKQLCRYTSITTPNLSATALPRLEIHFWLWLIVPSIYLCLGIGSSMSVHCK